jgi:hypothetical protein
MQQQWASHNAHLPAVAAPSNPHNHHGGGGGVGAQAQAHAHPATVPSSAIADVSMFGYHVATLPQYASLCSEAAMIVNRMPANMSGCVTVPMGGAIAMVCPEAMLQRSLQKPAWHSPDHRDSRRRLIANM